MATLDEEIERLKQIEQGYNELIDKMSEHPQSNYGLIQQAERKLSIVKLKRLDLESVGLV
jgi:hypothetical protein